MSANTFLTNQIVTYEALDILTNELGATKNVDMDYSDQFRFGGAVLGQTLDIRKPARYIGRLGQAINVEGITETFVPLTIAFQRGVDTQISTSNLALDIDNYRERILQPKLERLANLIDQDVCSLALGLNRFVGTPGVALTSLSTIVGSNSAKTKLDNSACPKKDRSVWLNPSTEGSLVDIQKGLFQSSEAIKEGYDDGVMGYMGGFKFTMDQNIYVHTTGTYAGTPLVDGANQSGSSILTKGWTSSSTTANAGDIVAFGNVYEVNPMSYQSTGQLMQFVLTVNTADVTGALTFTLSPPLVGPGSPLQNVSALPADNAVVYVWGATTTGLAAISGVSTPQNIAATKKFGTLAMIDMPQVGGTDKCYRAFSKKAKIAIRVIRDYIVGTDQLIERIDVLYGLTVLRQEYGVRIVT